MTSGGKATRTNFFALGTLSVATINKNIIYIQNILTSLKSRCGAYENILRPVVLIKEDLHCQRPEESKTSYLRGLAICLL